MNFFKEMNRLELQYKKTPETSKCYQDCLTVFCDFLQQLDNLLFKAQTKQQRKEPLKREATHQGSTEAGDTITATT